MTATATTSPRRRTLAPRSLTGKLVVGVVALVLVVVVAAGLGTYFSLRSFLYSRLDQQLGAVADSNQSQLIQCLARGTSSSCFLGGSIESPQVEWLGVFDSSGDISPPGVVESHSLRALDLGPSQAVGLLASPRVVHTVTNADGVELRVTLRPLDNSPDGLVLMTGLSTDEVDRTLRRLVELDLLIGGLGCVVALVATLYGVRFSLRRLYGVTATAREVAAELSPEGAGLDRRVPVHDTDTEVGQLADSMNTLLSAVETQFAARLASEQRMRQFLADASHELRTPLTSIRGYAELARMQQGRAGDAEDDSNNLRRIEGEGTRMSRLVDDLLLLARGDQGAERETGQVQLIDLAETVDDAVNRVHAGYPGRELRVDVGPDLMVIGDPDQLLRVLSNLITNAAVHTRPDRPIEVRGVRVGDTIELVVHDHGPGLPPEEAAQVFDRFWRADKARSRARGGSGLGLSIVASLVAAHAGTVHFASTVRDGSTVTVRLPAATGVETETDPA